MSNEVHATKTQLQNYLISRSFLTSQAGTILQVLDRLKCLQVDPINVVARSHELALWNRVKDFKLSDLSTHLYQTRSLFEYWLQLFSIIPTQFYPFLSNRMQTGGRWQTEYLSKHATEIRKTLAFVKTHGVSTSKDLSHIPSSGSLLSWSDSSRTAVLEYLWDTGKLMIHHREKNQKFYDLTERVISLEILANRPSLEDSRQFFLESAFDYIGILRKSFASHVTHRLGYVDTFAVGALWDRWLATGKIRPLFIPKTKTKYYILERQIGDLEKFGQEPHSGLNLLSPLDPLVIDRQLLRDFFNFPYTWEAYTPPAKRKFGYYGLPLLYHGQFIGQLDARKNKRGKLEVLKLQSSQKSPRFKKDLSEALRRLQQFVAHPD